MLRRLEAAGYVDDARFARERARIIAERGYGDAFVRADLEGRGVDGDAIDEAIAGLSPEAERARRLADRLGGGARTAAALIRKGFGSEAVETALNDLVAREP